jgi:hypothetical protein
VMKLKAKALCWGSKCSITELHPVLGTFIKSIKSTYLYVNVLPFCIYINKRICIVKYSSKWAVFILVD